MCYRRDTSLALPTAVFWFSTPTHEHSPFNFSRQRTNVFFGITVLPVDDNGILAWVIPIVDILLDILRQLP